MKKLINSAFLECGFPPLKYKVVDTLTVARQNFKFSSNKLAYLNKKLGIRNKIRKMRVFHYGVVVAMGILNL